MRRFAWQAFFISALFWIGVIGCEPTFKPSGMLLVEDVDFRPIACHVMVNTFGIAFENATGARLELLLPPTRLDAWRSTGGVPQARFIPNDGVSALNLGACGALTLTGEGYHGQTKRAVSGKASLSCSSGVTVTGNLTFSGCF